MKPLLGSQAGPGRIALRSAAVLMLLAGCTPIAPPTTTSPPATILATPATSSASATPIDTTNWIRYSSKRYDFSLKHPPGWTVIPAERDWTLKADAGELSSGGQEGLVSPTGDLFIAVWATPVGDTTETIEGVAAWVERFCTARGQPLPRDPRPGRAVVQGTVGLPSWPPGALLRRPGVPRLLHRRRSWRPDRSGWMSGCRSGRRRSRSTAAPDGFSKRSFRQWMCVQLDRISTRGGAPRPGSGRLTVAWLDDRGHGGLRPPIRNILLEVDVRHPLVPLDEPAFQSEPAFRVRPGGATQRARRPFVTLRSFLTKLLRNRLEDASGRVGSSDSGRR